jgi:hypothetical protein
MVTYTGSILIRAGVRDFRKYWKCYEDETYGEVLCSYENIEVLMKLNILKRFQHRLSLNFTSDRRKSMTPR